MKISIISGILVVVVLNSLNAQATKKRVILVNGIATEVLLDTEGNIVQTYGEVPNHMSAYNSEIKDEFNRNNLQTNYTSDNYVDALFQFQIEFENTQNQLSQANIDDLEKLINYISSSDFNGLIFMTINVNGDKAIAQKILLASKKYLQLRHMDPSKIFISYNYDSSPNRVLKFYIKSSLSY